MAYPKVHLHEPARYISAEEAASHISTYLSQASKEPYLHPDAIFSVGGLQFGNYGGSAGGLVLHQLRRVEKGLRGERIAVDIDQDQDQARIEAGFKEWEEGYPVEGDKRERKRGKIERNNVEDDAWNVNFSGSGLQQDEGDVGMVSIVNGDDDAAEATRQEKPLKKRTSKRNALENTNNLNEIAQSKLVQKTPKTLDTSFQSIAMANVNSDENETASPAQLTSEKYKTQRKLAKKERRKVWKQRKAGNSKEEPLE